MKVIRVLVVDDQAIVREGFMSIFSFQSDINVIGQACDGFEAVLMAKQHKPDVILLDLNMPNQNGQDSIALLRAVVPEAKIMILTGYGDADRVYQSIKAGAIGYLLKDATGDQLLQATRDVAKGQSHIDSSIAIKVIQEFSMKPASGPASGKINPSLTLTTRESDTLRLLAKGFSNKEIGAKLYVHERTSAKYVSNVLSKLQLENRTQAALYAIQEGLDK
jgi:DNA-binding NarL/FixJ family response regulator